MNQPTKEQLRSTLRQRRRALLPAAQSRAASNIAQLTISLPQWARAQHIALYHAADGEISTEKIAQLGRDQGKHTYFPVIGANKSMVFARWQAGEPLQPNALGIPESMPGAETYPATKLDIVFLPLLGWDQNGGRLGMGGGYYDRAFAAAEGPTLIGLGHQIQQVDEIPTDPWDISLELIVTDTGIYHRKK
ncbi:MAG: 5-formyltetrahydrofolate cyclo-ligase [Halioglobus sp.]|jgi:5-formyltetrahydrofolate cyclo-ligase